MSEELAQALRETLITPNEVDASGIESANVVDGLFAIARAVECLATQVKYLGSGDAATTMGAVEFLGKRVGDGLDNLASAISEMKE